MSTKSLRTRRLSLHPGRVPIFRRRRGRSRFCDRARPLRRRRCRSRKASRASKTFLHTRGTAARRASAPANCGRLHHSRKTAFAPLTKSMPARLRRWGVMTGNDNPVARSNVCPALMPPPEPSFHAFCFTVPVGGRQPDVSSLRAAASPSKGARATAKARCGSATRRPTACARKAIYVLGEMERRMATARVCLEGHDGRAGLHGARPASVSRR